jgi:tetratricopeptide (TPR) repeat protein
VAAESKAKLLDDAERYVLHGKIPQAISAYLKIVSIDPDDVLILNTIGDLYLKLNSVAEANRYFSKVADNYVRNSFFLKALAVYKKILSTEPNNIEINSIMASLYAKQGLGIDARNQYLRVAALFEREGKSKESLNAYEAIIELDPLNSDIHRKLAGFYQAEGAADKAQTHWLGAARAQAQTGDLNGAVSSYERAAQLAPLDQGAMEGLLACCLKMGNPRPAIEELKKSADLAPQNLGWREMLGRAYLESGDPNAAAETFHAVFSMDESRYENFFLVTQAFIAKEDFDQATNSLDPIIPILISRRETERAVKLYESILQRRPQYIPALIKLNALYSSIGDQLRCLETMDEIANGFLGERRPVEALEYLEKILQAEPESAKHRELHRQAFTQAYPDTPYIPPVEPPQSPVASEPFSIEADSVETTDILDAFQTEDLQSTAREVVDSQPLPETIHESPDVFHVAPSKSVQEQLQEVDFYIQLGFTGEAFEKLNEIAKANPNHPELASRYESLEEAKKNVPETIIADDSAQPVSDQSIEGRADETLADFELLDFDDILDQGHDDAAEKTQGGGVRDSWLSASPPATEPAPQQIEPPQKSEPSKPAETHVMVNDMFADLMDEVREIDREEAKAAFEEHFTLGMAYRDMDLFEEAIKEFETALKSVDMQKADPRVIQCCGMLSTCFLKKNMPHSALRWCQTGLGLRDVSPHESMALRYDMGIAHSMAGSKSQALECFDQIFSADPGYRDVAQRIDELRGGFERHDS